MNDLTIHPKDSSQKTARLWSQLFIGAIGIGMVLAGLPAQASESQTPWECSSYTGDAHTRCVETFAEWQRDQIAALQRKLQAQQETVDRIQDQLNRQASTNAELQRQLARPPAVVQVAPPLYTYPSVGLGFSLGSPWIYGPPFFDRPYIFGPGYYGHRHWGHRW
jgi:uncharacterized coiled-coil protein SlyX